VHDIRILVPENARFVAEQDERQRHERAEEQAGDESSAFRFRDGLAPVAPNEWKRLGRGGTPIWGVERREDNLLHGGLVFEGSLTEEEQQAFHLAMLGTSLAPRGSMLTRLALSFSLVAIALLASSRASADPLPRFNAAVVCVPSAAQEENGDTARAPGRFCLLRLPAWFEGTSVEVTPRAAITAQAVMKRLGAEVELKF